MSCLRLITIIVAGLGIAAGCRSPRDLDLERRIELHKRQQRTAAQAQGAAGVSPSAGTTAGGASSQSKGKTGPKPSTIADNSIRTYSNDQIMGILAKVPGAGPALHATIRTELGDIRCVLDKRAAPQTVANFVALATGQHEWTDPDTKQRLTTRFYDGMVFHRAIENFIIQTGNPGHGYAGPGWRLAREDGIPKGYDRAGTMGMVDHQGDTHGSQFFITLRADKSMAEKYTPFGRCSDLDLVRRIAAAEKEPVSGSKKPNRPKEPVRILKLEISWGPEG